MHEEQERAAFVSWLSSTYPHSYDEADAEHFWRHNHVSVLAWKERASLAKPQPVGGALTAEGEQYRRMFGAACEALGSINEALGLDPYDGGAEPILDAIDEMRARLATLSAPVAQPGEAVTLRAALEFAEDVMSRTPFSNAPVWGNGMHPNTGIGIIRDALATPIAAQPAAAEPVADEQIKAALMKYNDWAEGITFAGAIKAFRSLASPAQAAAVPAHSEIYAALRQAGLSLVKTVRGLHVVKLIEGEAQATTTGLAWNPEFLSPVEAYEQGRFDEQAAQGPNPYPDDGAVSQAAAVPEAVERDAARYRQLRRGQQWSVIDGIGDALRGEVLDAAIDRAALSQGDVSGEGEGA